MPGADGSYTPAAAAAKMAARGRALEPANMQRFMAQQAAKWQAATDTAFRAQRSPAGEQWPKLAASTLAARRAKAKGGKSRDRRGRYTGNQALNSSGDMRRTTKYLPEAGTIKVAHVVYLPPHRSGASNGRPPKRNPTVYERRAGKLVLVEPYGSQFRRDYLAHVEGAL